MKKSVAPELMEIYTTPKFKNPNSKVHKYIHLSIYISSVFFPCPDQ
jgi:hypothetical protein